MKFEELLKDYKNFFKFNIIANDSIIVYAPYFLPNGDNYPLGLTLGNNEITLTDMGEMQNVFEEFEIEENSKKTVIEEANKKFGINFDGNEFYIKCTQEEFAIAISSYFQALSFIFNN